MSFSDVFSTLQLTGVCCGYWWSGLGGKSGTPLALSRPAKYEVCQHPIWPCSPEGCVVVGWVGGGGSMMT